MVKLQTKINNNAHQGLGWVITKKLPNNELVINHDGGDPGVATSLILLPNSKNGLVVFVNSDNGSSVCSEVIRTVFNQGKKIVEGLYWENDIPETKNIEADFLSKYEGNYKTDRGFSMTFVNKEDHLLIESEVFPKLKIYPKSSNIFFPIEYELYFKFIENEQMQLITNRGKIDLVGTKK
jgi:hypothetical protein